MSPLNTKSSKWRPQPQSYNSSGQICIWPNLILRMLTTASQLINHIKNFLNLLRLFKNCRHCSIQPVMTGVWFLCKAQVCIRSIRSRARRLFEHSRYTEPGPERIAREASYTEQRTEQLMKIIRKSTTAVAPTRDASSHEYCRSQYFPFIWFYLANFDEYPTSYRLQTARFHKCPTPYSHVMEL